MIFSVKKLTTSEKQICFKTISHNAIFAIIGDAIETGKSISVIRMGDGELKILNTKKDKPFADFEHTHADWNKRLGINNMPIKQLQKNIKDAGNNCTYFAPSISGISIPRYYLHNRFKPRQFYFDNFYVNNWSFDMIKLLLETSKGVFIIHRDYKKIIKNFIKNYRLSNTCALQLQGFAKNSWRDNELAIKAASESGMQLILFSAGPGGKIIGPEIAKLKNKIALDIGNTLIPWSLKKR